MTQTRRIILLLGNDLEYTGTIVAPVAQRIATETADNVEITSITAVNNDQYQEQFYQAIRDAAARNEQPLIALSVHGSNNETDGRHSINFAGQQSGRNTATDQDTVQFIASIVEEYRRAYRQAHGAEAVPPRLLIEINACYSEGIFKDLPAEISGQADILVQDSQERPTTQYTAARIVEDLVRSGTAETIFVRQLLNDRESNSENSGQYSIPALATSQGIIDGDALGDRMTARNFRAMMMRARENIHRLSPEIQQEVASELSRLTPQHLNQLEHQRGRALLGYLANYDDRFTSAASYRMQGDLLREYYRDPNRPHDQRVALLERMDPDHRAMAVGVNDYGDMPDDFLRRPGAADRYGLTPLMVAVRMGNWRGSDLLLQQGVAVNHADNSGNTALHYAARLGNNNTYVLQGLLTNNAAVDRRNNEGRTALMLAIETNNLDGADRLLSRGANPNIRDNDDETALSIAVRQGNTATVNRLVKGGASLRQNNRADANLLIATVNPEHGANPEMLTRLLDAGIDVNRRNRLGGTALMEAADIGNFQAVNALIAAGADVNAESDFEGNALLNAVAYPEIVRVLLANRANVNIGTRGGLTPLFMAVRGNHSETVQLLRAAGATPGRLDRNGDGELSVAETEFPLVLSDLRFHRITNIDPCFDMNGNRRTTLEELAQQLIDHGVTNDQLTSREALLGQINRVAEQLRASAVSPAEPTPVPGR